ncbi:hypothetical protein CTA2_5340, partial [Colletotrichum tanaceti]
HRQRVRPRRSPRRDRRGLYPPPGPLFASAPPRWQLRRERQAERTPRGAQQRGVQDCESSHLARGRRRQVRRRQVRRRSGTVQRQRRRGDQSHGPAPPGDQQRPVRRRVLRARASPLPRQRPLAAPEAVQARRGRRQRQWRQQQPVRTEEQQPQLGRVLFVRRPAPRRRHPGVQLGVGDADDTPEEVVRGQPVAGDARQPHRGLGPARKPQYQHQHDAETRRVPENQGQGRPRWPRWRPRRRPRRQEDAGAEAQAVGQQLAAQRVPPAAGGGGQDHHPHRRDAVAAGVHHHALQGADALRGADAPARGVPQHDGQGARDRRPLPLPAGLHDHLLRRPVDAHDRGAHRPRRPGHRPRPPAGHPPRLQGGHPRRRLGRQRRRAPRRPHRGPRQVPRLGPRPRLRPHQRHRRPLLLRRPPRRPAPVLLLRLPRRLPAAHRRRQLEPLQQRARGHRHRPRELPGPRLWQHPRRPPLLLLGHGPGGDRHAAAGISSLVFRPRAPVPRHRARLDPHRLRHHLLPLPRLRHHHRRRPLRHVRRQRRLDHELHRQHPRPPRLRLRPPLRPLHQRPLPGQVAPDARHARRRLRRLRRQLLQRPALQRRAPGRKHPRRPHRRRPGQPLLPPAPRRRRRHPDPRHLHPGPRRARLHRRPAERPEDRQRPHQLDALGQRHERRQVLRGRVPQHRRLQRRRLHDPDRHRHRRRPLHQRPHHLPARQAPQRPVQLLSPIPCERERERERDFLPS